MSEQWDFYFCHVDGKPASIYLDLGLIEDAPLADFGFLGRVNLTMLIPQGDGLSSQLEYNRLGAIEDALIRQLSEGTRYVGRVTSDGHREFHFYLASDANWSARIAFALSNFPEYAFEADTLEDPEWIAYREFLYPDDVGRQSISNRHLCEALSSHGDHLEQARDIDHWALFYDAASRDTFLARASALGYTAYAAEDATQADDGFRAHVRRSDAPRYEIIDAVTHPLLYLAEELGGVYDGWGCEVVAEPEQDNA